MFVWIAREPRPDAPCWAGRRVLAALDAVAWPLLGLVLIHWVPGAGSLVRPAGVILGLWALLRLHGAVFVNHRYWFTTWLAMRLVALLWAVGILVKLAMPA